MEKFPSQGTEQQIKDAEEHLTDEQKLSSADREATYKAGYAEGKGPELHTLSEKIYKAIRENKGPYYIACSGTDENYGIAGYGYEIMLDESTTYQLAVKDNYAGHETFIPVETIRAIYAGSSLTPGQIYAKFKEDVSPRRKISYE